MKKGVVLHLIESWGPGGAETIVLELCRKLSEKSFYPIVGLLNDGWLNQELLKHGIETVIIKNRYPYDPFCLLQLIKIIRMRNVDIIHSHEFMMNVYGAIASILTNKPIITTIHGKNYYWEKWRRRLAYRFMGNFATRVIAVSEDLKNFVAERTGISRNKISVIYNGIDLNKYNVKNSCDVLKIKKELMLNSVVIGSVGNIYPVKGYLYLIQAAGKVIKRIPDITFLIIGKKTPYFDELKKIVDDLGINDHIKFLGFRSDIPELLALFDIYVSSSLSEGLSLSILQAMAAGKPVIATDVGGNQEIIRHGESGILIPPRNSEMLADSILILLENKTLASKLGLAARKVVEEKFSINCMIDNYIKLYESCKV